MLEFRVVVYFSLADGSREVLMLSKGNYGVQYIERIQQPIIILRGGEEEKRTSMGYFRE